MLGIGEPDGRGTARVPILLEEGEESLFIAGPATPPRVSRTGRRRCPRTGGRRSGLEARVAPRRRRAPRPRTGGRRPRPWPRSHPRPGAGGEPSARGVWLRPRSEDTRVNPASTCSLIFLPGSSPRHSTAMRGPGSARKSQVHPFGRVAALFDLHEGGEVATSAEVVLQAAHRRFAREVVEGLAGLDFCASAQVGRRLARPALEQDLADTGQILFGRQLPGLA